MKLFSSVITEKYRIEICCINLIILCYLLRTIIPVLKFPFLLLYSGFIVYTILNYRERIISTLIDFVRIYYLLLFLGLILFISFLLSNKIYLTIFKDVVNMVILFSIFILSTFIVAGKKELNFFVSNLIYLILLFAFVISILGLLDLLSIFFYNDFSQINENAGGSSDAYISTDYNFALLPVFFGFIGAFYFLQKTNSKLQIIYYNVLLFIFSINIILSGSRRGLFTFIAIMILLLIAQIFTFYKKNIFLRKLGSDSKYFLLSFFLLAIFSSYIAFNADYAFQNKALEFIGSKNIADTKQKIAVRMFRYAQFFGINRPFWDFYSRIWSSIPEDPDSGWGTSVHKTIFPLTGKNVEIVPKDAKGYLLDSLCNAAYYSKMNLCESVTYIVNLNVNKGDQYKASVYCFVSEDFDGNTVSFGNVFSSIGEKIVFGDTQKYYDLKSKGIWKKLEIEFDCNVGEAPIVLSFTQNGVKDFSKLKGYVIFAYPQYEKINGKNTDLYINTLPVRSDHKEEAIIVMANDEASLSSNVSLYQPKKLDNNDHYLFSADDMELNHEISPAKTFTFNKQKNLYSGNFCFPLSILLTSGLLQDDKDPVRNWASKFISEDTIYYPYKANITLEIPSNQFTESRLARWHFGWQIFTKEYNWLKKIFGGGFNFLNWYGYYFLKDKTLSDWPHNPFLAVLLYSGIFGLLIYCYFIYKVFYYYLKYIKEYSLMFIFFIITSFFSFFSGSSPFDPPIMGFFVILPFFIHSIHKKDNQKDKEITNGL